VKAARDLWLLVAVAGMTLGAVLAGIAIERDGYLVPAALAVAYFPARLLSHRVQYLVERAHRDGYRDCAHAMRESKKVRVQKPVGRELRVIDGGRS
jgi:hypothetical protein